MATAVPVGHRRIAGRYTVVKAPHHPREGSHGYVLEHILIAEKAIGHFLTPPAQVHHVDEDGHNNANSNLVVCQDQSYHWLLHRRTRAYDATGNANAFECGICHNHNRQDEIKSSTRTNGRVVLYHADCKRTEGERSTRFIQSTTAMRRSA